MPPHLWYSESRLTRVSESGPAVVCTWMSVTNRELKSFEQVGAKDHDQLQVGCLSAKRDEQGTGPGDNSCTIHGSPVMRQCVYAHVSIVRPPSMVLGPTLNRPASLYSFLTVLLTSLVCADILTSFARERHVSIGSSIFADVVTGDAPRTGP